jgi:hypothetical protein
MALMALHIPSLVERDYDLFHRPRFFSTSRLLSLIRLIRTCLVSPDEIMDLDLGNEFFGVDFDEFLEESSFLGCQDGSAGRPPSRSNPPDLAQASIEVPLSGEHMVPRLVQEAGQSTSDFPEPGLIVTGRLSANPEQSNSHQKIGCLAHSYSLGQIGSSQTNPNSMIITSNQLSLDPSTSPTLHSFNGSFGLKDDQYPPTPDQTLGLPPINDTCSVILRGWPLSMTEDHLRSLIAWSDKYIGGTMLASRWASHPQPLLFGTVAFCHHSRC